MKILVAVCRTNNGLFFHTESDQFKTKKAYKEALEAVGIKVDTIFTPEQIAEVQSDIYKCNSEAKNYVWDNDFAFQGEVDDKASVGNVIMLDYRAGWNIQDDTKGTITKVKRNYDGKVESVEVEVEESEYFQVGSTQTFEGLYFKRMATVLFDAKAEKERIKAEAEAQKQAKKQAREAEKKAEQKAIAKVSDFNETEQRLMDKLVEGNMAWHKRMSAKLEEDGYKHWHKEMLAGHITYNDLILMRSSEKVARKTFETDARHKVIKLKLRVSEIVGGIESYHLNHANNGDLEGYVVGNKGKAVINIFYAGGHTVQKLHFRATVKEIKG